MQFATVEDARANVEKQLDRWYRRHAFIFHFSDGLYIHWDLEDRYLFTKLPIGAQVLWHAAKQYNADYVATHWKWEESGPFNGTDINTVFELFKPPGSSPAPEPGGDAGHS